jgi:predicted Rossmann fold nucleotide-binding protein DprA/Smf involved in DNA uptake
MLRATRAFADLLRNRMLGLLCSMRCPGEAILKVYDLARALRDAKTTVIGGFHSPMEHECLEILSRGSQPIAICPARGLQSMRVPSSWRALLDRQRLLVISPFAGKTRRSTSEFAHHRNAFVADLADVLLVLHASPGGKVEELCLRLLDRGKSVFILEGSRHDALLDRGARAEKYRAIVGKVARGLSSSHTSVWASPLPRLGGPLTRGF